MKNDKNKQPKLEEILLEDLEIDGKDVKGGTERSADATAASVLLAAPGSSTVMCGW